MSKCLIGLVVIDAPHSALNNAGSEAGQATENIVVVKSMQKGRDSYPYVSGQAWRSWWRSTLEQEFDDWNVSPITREKKIAFTEASPAEYDDDDVFGYMRAQKKGTLTRLSPLKCSPLIAIEPQRPTSDFGVMARHEGDPVPFEHQFYGSALKGVFSLDLDSVGQFTAINRSGYENITEDYPQKMVDSGVNMTQQGQHWLLDYETRLRRVQQTIQALPYLSGGANLTLHLTDVTPKLLLMSVIEGGNHPFMNVMVEENSQGRFSIEALQQVIDDYSDRWLDRIYIGRRAGFMDQLEPDLDSLQAADERIVYSTPNQVIHQITDGLGLYLSDDGA
ncbi:MAG: type I-B CRISPR-associated protein Cas7/Cst2/DevR [Candidatus Poribacteria bacterium]|jgi:CRISPR-associated protein Cst2|nr:type I-B CRISPR-associated protein Cas7/Cst2/DevR [Candidatus Poribacteria bacterium]MDP6751192.1 type I-B CRISPR-associated protein Cas7/Cst2/DevR [Candidatus Poribacteria bacterium]MDP6999642.1 type I-B CRISPR-associated protein Cas7/Cst2/DevR [Candidatus Poribacteria bacterium]